MRRSYTAAGDPGERPAIPAWVQPPQDEFPVLLPVGEFLARTDSTVLTVSALEVYSTGLVIRAESVLRRRGESAKDWNWLMHGGFGPLDDGVDDRLRWRVELGGGESAELGGFGAGRPWDQEPDGWLLLPANGGGGGGGEDRYEQRHGLWLWPLPPPGPLRLVAEWRDRGIHERGVTLDGDAALDAVRHVRPLWP